MNKATSNSFLKSSTYFIVSLYSILSLAGCASTTEDKSGLAEKLKQQSLQDELSTHIKDYEKVKPALERLVALESDLRLLMTQIAQLETINTEDDLALESDIEVDTNHKSSDEVQPFTENKQVDNLAVQKNPLKKLPTMDEAEIKNTKGLKPVSEGNKSTQELVNAYDNSKSLPTVSQMPELETDELFLNVSTNTTSTENKTSSQAFDVEKISNIEMATDENLPRLFPEELYSGCAPKQTKISGEAFGIHVASFKIANKLPEGWNNLVIRNPELCDKGAVVQRVSIKNTTFFSMRVGPYLDKKTAQETCSKMKKQSQYCRVTDFSGEIL